MEEKIMNWDTCKICDTATAGEVKGEGWVWILIMI